MPVRSPIIAFLGHVDHGKTTLADAIRGSNIAAKEAGAITQMIGASYVPRATIDTLSQSLAEKMRFQLKIPGLLFIDTPGHEAFTNLRERGGSIADMAILVVDVTQGFQPQTLESIRILKQYKTPFVIAANKIDLVHGWKKHAVTSFAESYALQPPHLQQQLDEKLYSLMGALSEHGLDSERFDRINDFSKQVAILPVSAKTREGLSELLMLIAGLSQKFLASELEIDPASPAKGSILEVKEEKGLGTTIDVILYDGVLRKNDEIVFLTPAGVRTTHVRGLLEPNIRGPEKYRPVDAVVAASGVKIFAPGLEAALPGSPMKRLADPVADRTELEKQFRQLLVKTESLGVVLCADSLGSLEALLQLFQASDIPVKETKVGKITRKEVLTAKAVAQEDRYAGAVLGFNVPVLDEARAEAGMFIPIVYSNIIYELVEKYKLWVQDTKEKEKKLVLGTLPYPAKLRVLPGLCFRMRKPAVFGIAVLVGKIKNGVLLANAQGELLGELKGIQHEKKELSEAEKGMEVAIACDGPTYGKDIREEDVLYVRLNKTQLDAWEKQKAALTSEEKQVLEEWKRKIRLYF